MFLVRANGVPPAILTRHEAAHLDVAPGDDSNLRGCSPLSHFRGRALGPGIAETSRAAVEAQCEHLTRLSVGAEGVVGEVGDSLGAQRAREG